MMTTLVSRCFVGSMIFRSQSTSTKTPSSSPVVIVGGGPVGLYMHLLLRLQNVESIVIERAHQTPSYDHPRAHVLHTRTMELMRAVGLEERIRAAAPPPEQWRHFRYCESLTGRDLGVVDHFAGDTARQLEEASPTSGICHLSQPKLESILHEEILAQAEARGAGDSGLLYGRRVVGVTQEAGKVTSSGALVTASSFLDPLLTLPWLEPPVGGEGRD